MTTPVSGTPRPLVLDTAGADAPDADPSARALAEGLAAGLPAALRLSRARVFTVLPPGRRAADGSTPLGPLRDWLVTGSTPPRPPAAPRRRTPPAVTPAWWPGGGAIPDRATLVLPGITAWTPGLATLLARRPDIRAVAVLDGPVALDWPEYAAPTAVAALPAALAALAAGAHAIAVPDEDTARRLEAVLGSRSASRLVVEPRPSALAGSAAPAVDPALAAACYMVACGPIESRANTTLLLQIWRDLAARDGIVPRLVLAGARGMQIEDIRPLLDWNAILQAHVVEAPRLSPDALRTLLVHARALVAPDFAALDTALLRDAAACGVPVIAAADPVRAAPGWTCRHPLDGTGWRAAVLAAAARAPSSPAAPPPVLPDWPGYAARLVALGDGA